MEKLTLSIDLGNEAMTEESDIADAVQKVAGKIRDGYISGNIRDVNGSTVGHWEFS